MDLYRNNLFYFSEFCNLNVAMSIDSTFIHQGNDYIDNCTEYLNKHIHYAYAWKWIHVENRMEFHLFV